MEDNKLKFLFQYLLEIDYPVSEVSCNILHRISERIAIKLEKLSKTTEVQSGVLDTVVSFIEECFVSARVCESVALFALKLLTKILSHNIIISDTSNLLGKLYTYFSKETGCARDSAALTHATISCFTAGVSHSEAGKWISIFHDGLSSIAWRELSLQRSVYLVEAASTFISELILLLDRGESVGSEVEKDVISPCTKHIVAVWSRIATTDAKDNRRLNCLRYDVEFDALSILLKLVSRGCRVREIFLEKDRLKLLLNVMNYREKLPVLTGILVKLYEVLWKRGMTEDIRVLTNSIEDGINFPMSDVSLFPSAHKFAVSFISRLQPECYDHVEWNTVKLVAFAPLDGLLDSCASTHKEIIESLRHHKTTFTKMLCDIFDESAESSNSSLKIKVGGYVEKLLCHITDSSQTATYKHIYCNLPLLKAVLRFLETLSDDDISRLANMELSATVLSIGDIDVPTSTVVSVCRLVPRLARATLTSLLERSGEDHIVSPTIMESHSRELGEDHLKRLADWIRLHLSDTHWEVRDAVVEMIAQFIGFTDESTRVTDWLTDHGLIEELWSLRGDSEAYVRASVLLTISLLLYDANLRTRLLEPADSLKTFLGDVLTITVSDDDQRPRRAAVKVIQTLYPTGLSEHERTLVHETMYGRVVLDSDWEVKRECLHFWENVMNEARGERTASTVDDQSTNKLFHVLGDSLCLQSLVAALNDCDPSVAELAKVIISPPFAVRAASIDTSNETRTLPSVDEAIRGVDDAATTCRDRPWSFTLDAMMNVARCLQVLTVDGTTSDEGGSLEDVIDELMASSLPRDSVQYISDEDDDIVVDCY